MLKLRWFAVVEHMDQIAERDVISFHITPVRLWFIV